MSARAPDDAGVWTGWPYSTGCGDAEGDVDEVHPPEIRRTDRIKAKITNLQVYITGKEHAG